VWVAGSGFRYFWGFVLVLPEDDQIYEFPAPSPVPPEDLIREKECQALRQLGPEEARLSDFFRIVKVASSRERLGTPILKWPGFARRSRVSRRESRGQ
jgi:hypothetical protein